MIDEKMNFVDLEKYIVKAVGELKRKAYAEGFENGFKQGIFNERKKILSNSTKKAISKKYTKGLSTADAFARSMESVWKIVQQRNHDQIIQQAKDDIDSLKSNYKDLYDVKDPFDPYDPIKCYAEFFVNKEKRVVVALLRGFRTNKIYVKGFARCAPNDCFNTHIGKAIALRRALSKEVPEDYLNAPQPIEVRAGNTDNCIGKIIDDSREEN